MAGPVLGQARVIVNADTQAFKQQVQRGLKTVERQADKTSRKMQKSFRNAFSRGFERAGTRLFGKDFVQRAEESRLKLARLVRAFNFIGPAIVGVVGALGGLLQVLITFSSVVGGAIGSSIALGAAIVALVQGAATLKIAFNGVGEAFKAGLKPGGDKDLTSYLRRIEDARLRLAKLINSVPQLLAEAQEKAREAADKLADSIISEERALRTYNKAQERTFNALNGLNEAREQARQRIKRLRFEVEGGAISEKKARIQFEKAREALQRVQDLPPNSRARQEAELAFAEADLNLRRAIDTNQQLKKEEEKSTQAGVEGSEEVLKASREIVESREAEKDAQINLAKAIRATQKAKQAAAQAEADAAPGGRVEQEINEKIGEAREQLRRALEDLERAKRGGGNEFLDLMKELSPEAQRFVNYLLELKKAKVFQELRFAAGRKLFLPLELGIQNLIDNLLPTLERLIENTGGVLGDAALNFSKTVTEGRNVENLETVWKNGDVLLGNFGEALNNVYTGMLALLAAAEPVILRFGQWIETLTKTWKESMLLRQETGDLTKSLSRSADIAARLGLFFKQFFQIFRELGKVINEPGGAGDTLLDWLIEATAGIRDFIKAGQSPTGEGSLSDFFVQATKTGIVVLQLLGDIVKAFLTLAANPETEAFVNQLREVVTIFSDAGNVLVGSLEPLGEFLIQFARNVKVLTETESINLFFRILNEAFTRINDLLENELVYNVFVFLAQIKAVALAIWTIYTPLAFVGRAFIGSLLKPINLVYQGLVNIGPVFGKLAAGMVIGIRGAGNAFRGVSNIFARLFTGIGKLVSRIPYVGKVFGPIFKSLGLASGALGKFGTAIAALAGPLAILVGVFAIVGIYLYNTNEEFREMVNILGQKLLPVWDSIKNAFMGVWENLKAAFEDIKAVFMEVYEILAVVLFDAIKTLSGDGEGGLFGFIRVLQFIIEFVGGLLSVLIRIISDVIVYLLRAFARLTSGGIKIFLGLFQYIKGTLEALKNFFTGILKIIVGIFTLNRDLIKEGFGQSVSGIIGFFVNLFQSVLKIGGGIVDIFRGVGNLVLAVFGTLFRALGRIFNAIANAWNNSVGSLSWTVPDWVPVLGGRSYSAPKLPLLNLAKGGIVPAIPGGIIARIGEAGSPERVEPLDPDGLSKRDKAMIEMLTAGKTGATINVYPSAGMDERELANLVSRQLAFQMRKGAA
jgi:hypothetical protein